MYLRVSVTDRCNLRCTYCLPERARFAPDPAAPDEIDRLMAAVCAAAGVRKIRITGGEPTLAPALLQHIRTAAWLVPTVGMTSNGVLLAGMAGELRAAGLGRLNISLDAADAAGFRRATRRDRFAQVVEGIRAARAAGFAPLKLNAVATTDTDAPALARFAIAEGVHLRFIELMDIGEAHTGWAGRHVASAALRDRLAAAGLALREEPERDEPTSRVWTIPGVDPARTTLGFITTVSDPFCATCDRIRLSSRGRLHTCLFDERGTDLLAPLRAGDLAGLDAAIRRAVAAKAPPAHFRREGVMAGIGG
ncbi:MAG: radical SAM protein [Planctomycetes bacterium]|nr:radical SAM protein [Planctomycetota bacterium]